jgi:hypothetical protein
MDETSFWISLMFRVSAEGMPTKEMRRHWCDGFIPEQYLLDDSPPRIIGRAGFVSTMIRRIGNLYCCCLLHFGRATRSTGKHCFRRMTSRDG